MKASLKAWAKITLGALAGAGSVACAALLNVDEVGYGERDAGPSDAGPSDGTVTLDASDAGAGDAGPSVKFVEVVGGVNFACARAEDGRVACWGFGYDGQLGDGRTVSSPPVWVKGVASAAHIYAGSRHACAIDTQGKAKCWGDTGYPGGSEALNKSLEAQTFARAALGLQASCFLTDGTPKKVQCFGANRLGQLGPNPNGSNSEVTFGGATPQELVANYSPATFCALLDSEQVHCWGAGGYGELGTGATGIAERPQPEAVLAETTAANDAGADADAGPNTTRPLAGAMKVFPLNGSFCAKARSGEVSCWGAAGERFPNTLDINLYSARRIAAFDGADNIVAANQATCILKVGEVFCIGGNAFGEAGQGDAPQGAAPDAGKKWAQSYTSLQKVAALSNIAGINASASTLYAVSKSGDVFSWGRGYRGALGVGGFDLDKAVQVKGEDGTPLSDAKAIVISDTHACATTDNGLKCWGSNGSNALGFPIATYGYGTGGPSRFAFGEKVLFSSVSVQNSGTCGTIEGVAKCWGYNGETKRMGNAEVPNPEDLSKALIAWGSGPKYSQADLGLTFACATRNCGDAGCALDCAGDNTGGQVNPGDTQDAGPIGPVNRVIPSIVSLFAVGRDQSCAVYNGKVNCAGTSKIEYAVTNPVALGVGSQFGCVLTADGQVKCWNGSEAPSPVKVKAGALNLIAVGKQGALAVGYRHACAIESAEPHGVVCWGENVLGQRGNGTRGAFEPEPQPVLRADRKTPLQNAIYVAAGVYSSCAIVQPDRAKPEATETYCWGANDFGQLGEGYPTARFTPSKVPAP
jgi:alpha-tubulin suppressor-like RCC1 family protein